MKICTVIGGREFQRKGGSCLNGRESGPAFIRIRNLSAIVQTGALKGFRLYNIMFVYIHSFAVPTIMPTVLSMADSKMGAE